MQVSAAETLGLEALTWLAGDETAIFRFLDLSGLTPADLRERAGDPDLLAGILDFLLADESLLTRFCAEGGLTPARVTAARRSLPGSALEM